MRRRRRLLLTATVSTLAISLWLRMGPLPEGMLEDAGADSTIVLDRRGEILYEARAADGSRSTRLDAASLTPALVNATIAAEDHHFWRHPGLDPVALLRATLRNLRYRRVVEGGSTISQQTAKLLLARSNAAPRSRGFGAKLREAVIALRLEHRFSKREILALYLNAATYGNQLTGAERASRAYFGRGASLLTPAQAAYLAALPQRPSTFNPYHDPERARGRQQRVIVQMGLLGYLSPDGVRESLDERLVLSREPAAFVAPHFVARVLASVSRSHTISTTLDADLQRTVQGIIRAERSTLTKVGAHNAAVVVLDNRTGGWLAWEGSGDYSDARHGGAIDGVVSPRQPGSALKPFTYARAFEDGDSPSTVLPDVPSYFSTAEAGVLYSPRNYDNQFRGPLLARRALAGSENVAAVALASRVGVPTLVRFLRAAGLTTLDKTASYYGLGVTLGDAEVRLDELVAAYAAFARGGLRVHPRFIRADDTPEPSERLVSSRTAFWITDILSDDEARAFAFGRGGSLEFAFPVAAKTGTSQAYRDNWAFGYTRAVTVGVWVGNFDRRPLIGSSGVSGAGPIFHAVMTAAEARAEQNRPSAIESATLAQPEQTMRRTVCALSGMAAAPWCPAQIEEWVAAETSRTPCTWHQPSSRGVVVRWPAEYLPWARGEGLLDRTTPAPVDARVRVATLSRADIRTHVTRLRVANPPDGATYLIDPTLRREFQTLPLRAVADDGMEVEWRVDGEPVGRGAAGASVDWPLIAGAHRVTARDARGREAGVAIVVK